mmetsp:Transcript_15620/g.39189  ORF Transcript_15620/g.39189 Transcript_15620/m.39189 type:complete len:93 (+) Transcript_15620:485-763(+)
MFLIDAVCEGGGAHLAVYFSRAIMSMPDATGQKCRVSTLYSTFRDGSLRHHAVLRDDSTTPSRTTCKTRTDEVEIAIRATARLEYAFTDTEG